MLVVGLIGQRDGDLVQVKTAQVKHRARIIAGLD
jgi:hypothetical protein